MDILGVLLIGLLYGIKHSFEPDHVVAMSTIVSKSKSVWSTAVVGVLWGLGHVVTLVVVGVSLILLKQEIPHFIIIVLELVFALFLIYIGVSALRNKHFHVHHDIDFKRMKIRSLFIGFIHGLIGSTFMILIVTNTEMTQMQSIINVIGFAFGTFVGMVGFTVVIGLPFVLSSHNKNINKYLSMVTGVISILFGLILFYEVVINFI
ncbi:urease accessory protein UreH [Mycoplasmatota bacterium WC44]